MNTYDNRPTDQQTTPLAEYSVFSGELTHPKDTMRAAAGNESFMIDLAPFKAAAHTARLESEKRSKQRRFRGLSQ